MRASTTGAPLVFLVAMSACVPARILGRNVDALARSPRAVEHRITDAKRDDARLAVLWVGHATTLIQIDDRFVLTDPVFTESVGAGFSRRLVEPGIDAADLPHVDVGAVSHLHFDHLSLGTLDMLESKLGSLVAPPGALAYIPEYRFAVDEVSAWHSVERGGVRVTAVPVRHPGFRYGADAAWKTKGATAWVFEYHGLAVYFGGDTAYDRDDFVATRARFPDIALAILPIGPVEPPSFARPTHMDGREALQAFADLGAAHMVPIHYDTFAHGIDAPGYAVRVLRDAMVAAGVGTDRVHILAIGGQAAIVPRRER